MVKESIKKRFEKMIKYCDELIAKCKDRTIDDLYDDDDFAEASCFVLGLIGEQVPGIKFGKDGSQVKDEDYGEFFEKYKQIKWNDIKGTRNKIFHDYDGVNMELIWQTLQDIPNFKNQLEQIIENNE